MKQESYAGRVDSDTAELIERALAEQEITASEFVRRAIEVYIHRNPDEILAFYPENSMAEFVDSLF